MQNLPNRVTDWIGSPASLLAHSIFFVGIFALRLFGMSTNDILLILTTLVSLEAIYLAIFIQMTVNRQAKSLQEVEEDIDEIQEDVEDIQEDVQELEEGIGEIQEDIGEIQEDETPSAEQQHRVLLENIIKNLQSLTADIETLKKDEK